MTASLSAANSNLPSPASDLSTLISASSNKGFSATEMVALSVVFCWSIWFGFAAGLGLQLMVEQMVWVCSCKPSGQLEHMVWLAV
ncbi:peroxidase [Sarracenia purpurea var. burkii]